jgi:hypothetical protein
MSKALREIAVVREQEEAFSLSIEPADVEKARQMWRQQIEDGVPRVRIAPGRNESGRFMQHDVEPALAADEFAVDFDVVAFPGLGAEIGADLAVEGDASGRGKETVEAHGKVEGLRG